MYINTRFYVIVHLIATIIVILCWYFELKILPFPENEWVAHAVILTQPLLLICSIFLLRKDPAKLKWLSVIGILTSSIITVLMIYILVIVFFGSWEMHF